MTDELAAAAEKFLTANPDCEKCGHPAAAAVPTLTAGKYRIAALCRRHAKEAKK